MLVKQGYCIEHTRTVTKRYRDPKLRSLYNTKRWRVRSRAFLVDHPICACGCGRLASDVDHKIPFGPGSPDFWDETNWQGLAHDCHSRKTKTDIDTRTYQYPDA